MSGRSRVVLLVSVVVLVFILGSGYYLDNRHGDDRPRAAPDAAMQLAMDPTQGARYAMGFGDSYFNGSAQVTEQQTFGFLALTDLGYTASMQGRGGTGYAVSSGGSPNYVDQIDRGFLSAVDPDVELIVLEGGINDAEDRAVPIATIEANARTVMTKLRQKFGKAKLYVLGVTADVTGSVTGRRADVTAAIRRSAAATQWTFVDVANVITPANVAGIMGPDRYHPTVAGHKQMSATLVADLKAAGVAPVTAPSY